SLAEEIETLRRLEDGDGGGQLGVGDWVLRQEEGPRVAGQRRLTLGEGDAGEGARLLRPGREVLALRVIGGGERRQGQSEEKSVSEGKCSHHGGRLPKLSGVRASQAGF